MRGILGNAKLIRAFNLVFQPLLLNGLKDTLCCKF